MRCKRLLLFVILLLSAFVSFAESRTKTIVYISSYQSDNKWTSDIVSAAVNAINKETSNAYDLHFKYIYLNSKEISNPQKREDILKANLSEMRSYVDLVIVTGLEATTHVINCDDSLLNNTPIVFGAFIDEEVVYNSTKQLSGVISTVDIDDTYHTAKSIFPNAKKLYVVADNTDLGKFFMSKAREQLSAHSHDTEIEYDVSANSLEELLDKMRNIDPSSLVMLCTWQRDDMGRSYNASVIYPLLAKNCPAPIFTTSSNLIKEGLVGGYVMSPESFSTSMGMISAKILKEGKMGKEVVNITTSTPVFNKRVIKDKGGNISFIPQYSKIVNSMWGFIVDNVEIITQIFVCLILLLTTYLTIYYRISYKKYKNMMFYSYELKIAKRRKDLLSWSYNYNTNSFRFGDEAKSLGINPKDIDTVQKLYDKVYFADIAHMQEIFMQLSTNKIKEFTTYYRADFQSCGKFQWWECRGELINLGGERYSYGLLFNVDRLMQTEEKLKEALEEAKKSDNLKSAFLANMSHEIRTPLNSILGFSQLIAQTEDAEEREEYSEIIQKNGDELLKLVNDVLNLSKIEAGIVDYKREIDDFSTFFEYLAKSFKTIVTNPDVQLICINPYKSCILSFDRYKVQEIYNNFISNAVKFTSKGSVTMGYEYVDGGLKMYVSDTGIGIAEDKREIIFERFEKIDQYVQGTGLGLSICKSFIEKVGGKIGVDSQLGVGSTFWAWIPRETEAIIDK